MEEETVDEITGRGRVVAGETNKGERERGALELWGEREGEGKRDDKEGHGEDKAGEEK
jgi:hypothetical protein